MYGSLWAANSALEQAWANSQLASCQMRVVAAPLEPATVTGTSESDVPHIDHSSAQGDGEHESGIALEYELTDSTAPADARRSILYDGTQARTGTQGVRVAGFNGNAHSLMALQTFDPDHVDNGGTHNKFMVCDHCMSHGLPCNEASVCDQCRLYDQPCVHRWCRTSPETKADCENNKCRYAHQDTVIARGTEPRWIVLAGKLPGRWSNTRIASRTYLEYPETRSGAQLHIDLDRKQGTAVQELRCKISNGEGALHKLSFDCSCATMVAGLGVESRPGVCVGSLLEEQPEVCRMTGTLAYLNDFMPGATIEHDSSDDESSDSGSSESTSTSTSEIGYDENDEAGAHCRQCGKCDDYYSVAPCNHRMCIECCIRLRGMEEDQDCPQCGRYAKYVVFTHDARKRFAEYDMDSITECTTEALGILFENAVVRKDTLWMFSQLQL
ncbi:hypothetical protein Slin14017_G035310 [Septoria linicola]|nr:hypothetical protein Slin14017_G035310 [Septoria linicola]